MGTFKVAFDGGERAILDVCFGESWPPKMCSARGGAPEKFKHDDRRGDPERPYLDIDAAEEGGRPWPLVLRSGRESGRTCWNSTKSSQIDLLGKSSVKTCATLLLSVHTRQGH
jgi:hypothetical protein